MAPTTIQYASDLHLDHFPGLTADEFETFLFPSAPILVLAGDIASAWHPIYPKFLQWVAYHWDHVILIAGNHEYHCEPTRPQSRLDTDRRITDLCWKFRNLHFLQNGSSFYLPQTKIVFLGATYYSDINPAIHDEIRHKSDFCNSYNESLCLNTPADFVRLHAQQKQALSDAIRSVNRGYKVIIVTHYMPTMNLLEPEYRYEAWRSCYASQDDAMIRPPVSFWICGHSHRQALYKTKNGIQLAMNARGYNKPHELERTNDKYSKYGRVVLNYI